MKKVLDNNKKNIESAKYFCYEKIGNKMQYTILDCNGNVIARIDSDKINNDLINKLTKVNDAFINSIYYLNSEKIGNYYLIDDKKRINYTNNELKSIANAFKPKNWK